MNDQYVLYIFHGTYRFSLNIRKKQYSTCGDIKNKYFCQNLAKFLESNIQSFETKGQIVKQIILLFLWGGKHLLNILLIDHSKKSPSI